MRNRTKHNIKKSNKTNSLIRQYAVYEPDFKKAVIKYAEEKSTKEATKRYGISASNIRRWRRLKQDILGKTTKSRRLKKEHVDITLEHDHSSSLDSMPLEQRLKAPNPSTSVESSAMNEPAVLQSQPLSPTKLKVTRQTTKLPQSSPKSTSSPNPDDQNVYLKWDDHHSNIQTTFPNLLLKEQYVDATLVAEGQCLKCHRMILSSCSPYFENVLSGISPFQHPVLFMKDIPYCIMKSICDFMYAGGVNISKNNLEETLAVAETLKIKGLASNFTSKESEVKTQPSLNIKEEKKEEIKVMKEQVKETKEKLRETRDNVRVVRERRRTYQPTLPVEMPVLKSAKLSKSTQQQQNIQMPSLKSTRLSRNKRTSRRAGKIERRNEKMEKLSESVEEQSKDPPDVSGIYDPYNLLEPVYEELTTKSTNAVGKVKETKSVPVKKQIPKKLKKRKVSDRDESPPPVLSRKGTRSRPNRKIPKFYHTPYERNAKVSEPIETTPIVREPHTDQADPLMPVEDIKSEPLDVLEDTIEIEDNVVSFSDHELTLPEEDIFEDFDTNEKTNKTEESKSMDSPGFKKISLLSEPVIMDGSNTVKIIDVTNITTNSMLSDDPLSINQSSTRITITNVQSVLDKEDSLSTDLGFRISEVMTEVDNKDDDAIPCKDLGFQITSITSASNEDDIKSAEIEKKSDNESTEASPSYIDSTRKSVIPKDNTAAANGLKTSLEVSDKSTIDQPVTQNQSETHAIDRDKLDERVSDTSQISPMKCNDNEVKYDLPPPENNISENIRITNCKTHHPGDENTLTKYSGIDASSNEVAVMQDTPLCNENDNIEIPNLLGDSSEKSGSYTSHAEIESEDFIQDTIDDLPDFHIGPVVDEQITLHEANQLTGTLDSELLSQVPVDELEASGNTDLRLESTDLETIVNDLTKIVGDARSEVELINVRNDLTNEIVDSLENLLEK